MTSLVLKIRELSSLVEDIPLFSLKKKLKTAKEEAVELVKEEFKWA